jgi:hypothetical protein
LPFVRVLASLLAANLISLIVLNSLRLPVWALVPVFGLGWAAAWLTLGRARIRRTPSRAPRRAVFCAVAALILLTVPRLPYLAEWLPGAAVLAQADDYGRLAELASMTLGGRYPLPHPSNQDFLLSHYYAALFPMAWFKLVLPVLTLKDVIFLGNLLYHILFLGSLIEVAPRLTRGRNSAAVFVFLMTLFGGFDILAGHLIPFEHTEHWSRQWLGGMREFSSFYTASYWTVHHMAGLWGILLAGIYWREARFPDRWGKPLLAGWLLVSAAACSAFVVLSLPLVAWRELWALFRRLLRTGMIAPVAAAALVPLWLYTGRVESGAFHWSPVPLAPPLYLLAVFAVDYAGLPLLLVFRWRHFDHAERRWFIGSLLFLASTWGIESIGYNNYSMRAGLLPGFVVLLLAARHIAFSRLALAAAVLATLTTVREAATMTYASLEFSNWYWQSRGKPVPAHVAPRLNYAYPRLARDRSVLYYHPGSADRFGLEKFNAEKLVRGLPPGQMHAAERELLRRR